MFSDSLMLRLYAKIKNNSNSRSLVYIQYPRRTNCKKNFATGLGNIPRFFSAESVKLPGWMGAVGGQTFSGLSTDVRLRLSQGSVLLRLVENFHLLTGSLEPSLSDH